MLQEFWRPGTAGLRYGLRMCANWPVSAQPASITGSEAVTSFIGRWFGRFRKDSLTESWKNTFRAMQSRSRKFAECWKHSSWLPGAAASGLALWAREVFTGPSEEFIRVVRASGTKHVMSIRRIIAAYLGIPDEGPEIETIVMAVMSPCLLVVASSPEVIKETYPNLMDAKGKEVAVEQLLSILQMLKLKRKDEA